MNRTDFTRAIQALLQQQVGSLSLDDRLAIVQKCIIALQKVEALDEGNKNKPWTDEELQSSTTPQPKRFASCSRVLFRGDTEASNRSFDGLQPLTKELQSSDLM